MLRELSPEWDPLRNAQRNEPPEDPRSERGDKLHQFQGIYNTDNLADVFRVFGNKPTARWGATQPRENQNNQRRRRNKVVYIVSSCNREHEDNVVAGGGSFYR